MLPEEPGLPELEPDPPEDPEPLDPPPPEPELPGGAAELPPPELPPGTGELPLLAEFDEVLPQLIVARTRKIATNAPRSRRATEAKER